MKQVRLLSLAAAMLLASQLLLAENGPNFQARLVANTQLNLTVPRAMSSLAIDTYGYYRIRVWVDGVLINRRPMDFVEIPQLHAGYRLIDVEIIGNRGNRFISETVYMYPGRWSLFSIEPGYYRDMYVMHAMQTQPIGYRYVSGRRQSINVGVNRPYTNGHIHINVDHQHHNGHQHGNGYSNDRNDHHQGNGRDYNRGGNSGNNGNNGVRDHSQGEGRGNGQGTGNGNNGVRDHGQGQGRGSGQGTGNGNNNSGGRRGN